MIIYLLDEKQIFELKAVYIKHSAAFENMWSWYMNLTVDVKMPDGCTFFSYIIKIKNQ